MTPTSFQLSVSVKSEYSGWVRAVPAKNPAAVISSSVYPAEGSAATGNGSGGVSATTVSKVTRVLPTAGSVQCAAVRRTVGSIRVAEQRYRDPSSSYARISATLGCASPSG
jgi:hypothetical protein